MKATEKPQEKQPIKVTEAFEKIMKARKLNSKEFAAFIGVSPGTISSSLGKEWNNHFRIFVKLLPDLCALDIIEESDLQGPVPYEPLTNSRGSKASEDQAGKKRAGHR